MVKQTEREEISRLAKAGLSVPQVAMRVGRSTTTVYRLLRLDDSEKDAEVATKIPKALHGYEDYLNLRIKYGITNFKKLFQELKAKGYQGSYASLYRYLKLSRQLSDSDNYKRSSRFETQPGEQAQVDWGHFRQFFCFVYILGYSRVMYIEFTTKQNLQALEQCHINAFKSLGIPKTIVYDNMKTVVLRRERQPDGKRNIHFNPAFLDFANYYGFEIRAHSPYWPRSKGKVEAGVKYVRNNFMQGMEFGKTFSSLEELNQKAGEWLASVANVRVHGSIGERPIDRLQVEKEYLNLITDFPDYSTSPFLVRNSTKNCMIQYKSNFYSVPKEYGRKKLIVREMNQDGEEHLEIYHEDKIIATHKLTTGRGEWIVDDKHIEKVKTSQKRALLRNNSLIQSEPEVVTRPLSYYDQLFIKK